jgi:hypothetical protein
MYKSTTHTGRTWGYKTTSVSSFSSNDECRAIVAKCSETFSTLGLLNPSDFEHVHEAMRKDATRVVGIRIRRGKEMLLGIGVPERLLFTLPNYLLVAPKLGGLLSRMCRIESSRLPHELRQLQTHLKNVSATRQATAPKPTYHVAADGTRTAVYPTQTIQERRRQRRFSTAAPERPTTAPTSKPKPKPKPQRETAMSVALQLAQQKKR